MNLTRLIVTGLITLAISGSAFASAPQSISIPIKTNLIEINLTKIMISTEGDCGDVTFNASNADSGTLDFDSIPAMGNACYVYFCSGAPCGKSEPQGTHHDLHIILTLMYSGGIGLWQDTLLENKYMFVGNDGPAKDVSTDILCNKNTLDETEETCALELKSIK